MSKQNKILTFLIALIFVLSQVPILNANNVAYSSPTVTQIKQFNEGINFNQKGSGFFNDAVYPLEGNFHATTYEGHVGAGSLDMNKGSTTYGSPIHAVKDGKVYIVKSGCPNIGALGNTCNGGYGNHIIIDHGNGYQTIYAHVINESIKVKEGQQVKRGDLIANVGSSGNSSGPHLHFEIRKDGKSVPVSDYFYFPKIEEMN